MIRLIKQVFIALLKVTGSLSSAANVSNITTCITLNNQPYMTRPTLIDLNPDEYNQALRYYPFMVKLDRCNGSYNNLDEPSGRRCVANKTEDINLKVFNMITRINESKTLTKHVSCECKI